MRRGYMPYEEEDTCVTIDLLDTCHMRRGYMPYEEIHVSHIDLLCYFLENFFAGP